MATDVEGAGSSITAFQMDETYEFCAPRFFDFMKEETQEEIQKTEMWFETALSYAPSRTSLLTFFSENFMILGIP